MIDSKQRKLGAALSYLSIIVSTLVQLLYTPFLIKMLGQSEYGLYSLVASIIGYLTVLDLGFGNALIVYTAKYRASNEREKEKKLHGMFKIIFNIMGVIVAIVGVILYFNVDNLFGNTMTLIELKKAKIMMLILSFNLLMTFSFNIYSSIINAYEKFVFRKILSILNTILKPLIMIPLLFIGYKSIAMCVVLTIVNVLILLFNYFYCKKNLNIDTKYIGFDKKLFFEIFSYSIFIFLGVLVDKINWSVDQFVLGAVSGTIAVSIYSVASQLNTLFVNLSTAVSSVMLPKMSKMIAANTDTEILTDEMIKIGRIQYYIIFLMASGLVLVGKPFISWWVGSDYIQSYYVALLLIIPACIPLVQNLGICIRQAMNKHKFAAFVNIIVAIFNMIISIFLAKSYGAIGAAFGTGLGVLLSSIIINIYYHRNLKLDMIRFWKSIVGVMIPCLLPLIIIIIFMLLVKLDGLIAVVVYGIMYTIIYLFTIYYISMNDYEKDIIKSVKKKILRR